MNVTLELPEKLKEKLKEKARLEEKTLEEIILSSVVGLVCTDDPEAKSEMHLRLCEKYLSEGEEFLSKEDYVRASEKFWRAAAQVVKSKAAKRGEELRSHGMLHEYAFRIREEVGDPELNRLWRSASGLHQNFYEAWWPPGAVKEAAQDVKRFIEKVKKKHGYGGRSQKVA